MVIVAIVTRGLFMTRDILRRHLVLVVAAAVLAGCGGDPDLPKLGKVSGTVTYKGQPVTKGLVTFVPASGAGAQTGQSATGEIQKDGSFTLSTFENNDGAVLGEHIVVVQSREDDPALEGQGMPIPDARGRLKIKPPKHLVPEKYGTSDKSPLRHTVVEGSNTVPLNLED
jgi:hypothetical protein